jgi:CDP-diacylglycerol--glycerol-3-phosphate 3-phosphatidyltransferase
MNLPNRLTLARLFLTVLFVAVISVSFPYHRTLALILFVVASITDYIDGEIARRYALITDFGTLMDPLVDKIMTAAAFVCLVPLNALPAWVAIVVISREFMITGLRLLAVSKGLILSADNWGKHKTTWQIVTVIFFLVLLSAEEFHWRIGGGSTGALWFYGGWLISGIAVILTLYSGVGYLWKHRSMLETE